MFWLFEVFSRWLTQLEYCRPIQRVEMWEKQLTTAQMNDILHWQTVLAHNIQTFSLFNSEVYGEEMNNYVKNAIKSA